METVCSAQCALNRYIIMHNWAKDGSVWFGLIWFDPDVVAMFSALTAFFHFIFTPSKPVNCQLFHWSPNHLIFWPFWLLFSDSCCCFYDDLPHSERLTWNTPYNYSYWIFKIQYYSSDFWFCRYFGLKAQRACSRFAKFQTRWTKNKAQQSHRDEFDGKEIVLYSETANTLLDVSNEQHKVHHVVR